MRSFLVILVVTAFFAVCLVRNFSKTGLQNSDLPKAKSPFGATESHFIADTDGNAIAGRSNGGGFSIEWRSGMVPQGADPREVIECTLDRLKHLQRTNVGSNSYAKAIWNLEQAAEQLETTFEYSGDEVGGAGFRTPE